MHWLPNPPRPQFWGSLLVGLLLLVGPCHAAPPAPATAAAVPDYGGRDAPGLLKGAGAGAPDPAAQAGRSLLALVLVLGGVFGGVTLLKRVGYAGGPIGTALLFGLRRPAPVTPSKRDEDNAGGASAPGPLVLLQSQALPGGGAVHLLSVDDRTRLLVGASGQGVSLLAEWEAEAVAAEMVPAPQAAFREYLARVDTTPVTPRTPERIPAERLSDLLSTQRARSREDSHE